MAQANVNGINIEYETFGALGAPPLLLIMGLGGQLVHWDRRFCEQLEERGLYVIRFDNRDVGYSRKLDNLGTPDITEIIAARTHGRAFSAPYTLDDMAEDAVGVLDWLGLVKAHVVGTSMGGMIAQSVALRNPSRLLTLTSIMADTGQSTLVQREALEVCRPPPVEREAYIAHTLSSMRMIAGPRFSFDEQGARQQAMHACERGIHPQGHIRQLAALVASQSRKQALRSLTVPTLVIHGDADPLVPLAGGIETANSIPEAELRIIPGMGHELPPGAWPEIIEAIVRHTRKAARVS